LRKRIVAFVTALYLNAKKNASVPEKVADVVDHLPFFTGDIKTGINDFNFKGIKNGIPHNSKNRWLTGNRSHKDDKV
jgi:predicted HAD superfamily hydrolase